MNRPGEGAAVLGLMVVLSVLVYWPVFSSERLPGGELSDTVHQGYPFLAYTRESLSAGEIPLWNPYIFCGVPFYASFSSPFFYPLRGLPLILFGAEASVRFLFPLHLILAGFFTWLLTGAMGLSRGGRLTGAAAYALGGWANTLFYAGHGSKVICWAYLPLLLLAVLRFQKTRELRWIGVGALAVGMQGLSSHPQMMLYSGGMAAVMAIWHMGRPGQWPVRIAGIAAMMALGAGIAAVQLYPGYLFSRNSARGQGLDPERAASYSMPPEETLAMVFPSAFGLRHGFPDSSLSGIPVYFGRLGLRLSSEFTGVAVFILAMAGFVSGRDRRTRGALATLAVLGALVSWGGYTGFFALLYRAIPVFRSIRAPHMAAFVTATSVALAAGPGFDALFSGGRSKRALSLIAGSIAALLVLLLFSAPLSRALQSQWWARMGVPGGSGFDFLVAHRISLLRADLLRALLSSTGVLAVLLGVRGLKVKPVHGAWAVILITALELVPFNRSFQVYLHQTRLSALFPDDVVLSEAAGRGRVFPGGNELIPLGVRSVTGYHAAIPSVTDRMVSLLSDPSPEIIYQFGVSAFRFPEGSFTWQELHPALSESSPMIPGTPMPRVFIPTQPVSGTSEQGFQIITRGVNPLTVSIIEAPAEQLPRVCSGTAEIIADNPHEVVVRAESSSPSVLVLADAWYPRWRAEVDGSSRPVHVANGWMRAVLLPGGGVSTVRFFYDGSDVVLGMWISIAAALIALGLLAGRRRPLR